jgi:hypothetical protein
MLLLAYLLILLLGLAVGVAALVGVGRMVRSTALASADNKQAHRRRRLAAVLAASSVVGLAVWISASVRDPVVVVDGDRTHCGPTFGEDIPRRIAERCEAQHHDRSMQGRVAGLTAAVASAVVLWAAAGPRRESRVTAPKEEASLET